VPLAASIVNTVVGAGIFVVPAALAASVGVFAPFAFLVCAIAVGAVAICFAEGGSRIPTSGGAYGYIDAAFGPLASYVAGTLLWLGNVLACGSVVAALADVVASLVPAPVAVAVHAAVIISVIGTIALVNVSGVSRAARFVNVATVLKLAPLLVFVIAGPFAIEPINLVPAGPPPLDGVGRAVILALFALTGMEVTLSASGEVSEPARTIPRALLIAMVSVTILYVAIQTIAQGILGGSLAYSRAPLADAMLHINPSLRAVMLTGAGVSMFGYVGSDILGSPRILFAFSRDGVLPRALGKLSPRNHTPHVAILFYAALAIGLALSGTFAELAVLATLASAVVYALGCGAAWTLARRDVALAGPPLNFRWLGIAAVVGIGSMIVLIALASKPEIVGLLSVAGVSAAVYLVQTWSGLSRRGASSGILADVSSGESAVVAAVGPLTTGSRED
jgi:amino acid transporter